MKFYCDNCNAKYLIGDDKVRGKILRIRCKRCSHVIVVREPTQPAQIASGAVAALAPTVAAAAAAAAEPQKTIEWYYAMAGRTYGPFTLDALRNMFATGQLGDEAYVWNETFTSWVPALERSEFAHYFASGAVRKPPRPTVALGAIDVEAIEKAKAAAQKQSSSTHSVLGAAGPRTAMGPPGRGFSGQPTTALGPPGALSGHRGGAEKKRDGVERQATALTAGGKSAKRDPSSAVSRAAPSGVSSFGSASSPSGVSSLGSVSSPSGVSSLGNASPGGVSSPSSVSRVPSRRSGVLPSSRASQVSNLSASSSTSRLSTISSTADVSTSERLRMLRERLSARQSGTMPQVSLKERLRQLRKQSDGGAPDRPGPSASVSRPEQHTRADEATRVQSVPPESLARMKTSLPSPAPSSTSSSQQHVFDDGYGSVGEDEPTISGQEASTLMADALAQMRGLEQAELLSDPNNQPPDTDLVSTPSFTATGGVFGAVEEDSSPSGLQPSPTEQLVFDDEPTEAPSGVDTPDKASLWDEASSPPAGSEAKQVESVGASSTVEDAAGEAPMVVESGAELARDKVAESEPESTGAVVASADEDELFIDPMAPVETSDALPVVAEPEEPQLTSPETLLPTPEAKAPPLEETIPPPMAPDKRRKGGLGLIFGVVGVLVVVCVVAAYFALGGATNTTEASTDPGASAAAGEMQPEAGSPDEASVNQGAEKPKGKAGAAAGALDLGEEGLAPEPEEGNLEAAGTNNTGKGTPLPSTKVPAGKMAAAVGVKSTRKADKAEGSSSADPSSNKANTRGGSTDNTNKSGLNLRISDLGAKSGGPDAFDKGLEAASKAATTKTKEAPGSGVKLRAPSKDTGAKATLKESESPGLSNVPEDTFAHVMGSARHVERVEKVERAERTKEAPATLPSSLSRDQLQKGFKSVRRSAGQCLERHRKRSGSLPTGKVKVVVTIQSSGTVSDVHVGQVANTVFGTCMRSHMGRWRFPKFAGAPIQVSRKFVLQ